MRNERPRNFDGEGLKTNDMLYERQRGSLAYVRWSCGRLTVFLHQHLGGSGSRGTKPLRGQASGLLGSVEGEGHWALG